MLIFTRLIHSTSRGFPQWVELHCDDMDKLHPPWPLPPAVSGQRPVSRVPAAAARLQVGPGGCGMGRGTWRWAGGTHGSLSRAFRVQELF